MHHPDHYPSPQLTGLKQELNDFYILAQSFEVIIVEIVLCQSR